MNSHAHQQTLLLKEEEIMPFHQYLISVHTRSQTVTGWDATPTVREEGSFRM